MAATTAPPRRHPALTRPGTTPPPPPPPVAGCPASPLRCFVPPFRGRYASVVPPIRFRRRRYFVSALRAERCRPYGRPAPPAPRCVGGGFVPGGRAVSFAPPLCRSDAPGASLTPGAPVSPWPPPLKGGAGRPGAGRQAAAKAARAETPPGRLRVKAWFRIVARVEYIAGR